MGAPDTALTRLSPAVGQFPTNNNYFNGFVWGAVSSMVAIWGYCMLRAATRANDIAAARLEVDMAHLTVSTQANQLTLMSLCYSNHGEKVSSSSCDEILFNHAADFAAITNVSFPSLAQLSSSLPTSSVKKDSGNASSAARPSVSSLRWPLTKYGRHKINDSNTKKIPRSLKRLFAFTLMLIGPQCICLSFWFFQGFSPWLTEKLHPHARQQQRDYSYWNHRVPMFEFCGGCMLFAVLATVVGACGYVLMLPTES